MSYNVNNWSAFKYARYITSWICIQRHDSAAVGGVVEAVAFQGLQGMVRPGDTVEEVLKWDQLQRTKRTTGEASKSSKNRRCHPFCHPLYPKTRSFGSLWVQWIMGKWETGLPSWRFWEAKRIGSTHFWYGGVWIFVSSAINKSKNRSINESITSVLWVIIWFIIIIVMNHEKSSISIINHWINHW